MKEKKIAFIKYNNSNDNDMQKRNLSEFNKTANSKKKDKKIRN